MSAVDLLLEVRTRGVTFTPKGEALSYRGPGAALDPDTLARLREAKPILLAILRAERDNCPIPVRPCRACRGRSYWFGGSGPIWACGACHPPADSSFVLAWRAVPEKAPGSLSPASEPSRPPQVPWSALTAAERAIIQKARDVYRADFDSLLLARFAEGLVTADAEIAVVLELLDRELKVTE